MNNIVDFCKLCLRNTEICGKLQNSHIIPRFIFRKTKGASGLSAVFTESSNTLSFSQADWKQPLLCYECEQFLNDSYEKHLNEVLYLRRKTIKFYSGKERIILETSADKLALCLITIFWRAAISSLIEFKWAVAPEYVLEEMRVWIKTETILPSWDRLISIEIVEIVDDGGEIMHLLIPTDIRKNIDHFDFIFVCGGYKITFTIPPTYKQGFSKKSELNSKSEIVWIEKTNFRKIDSINRLLGGMVTANIPENMKNIQNRIQKKSKKKNF